MTFQVLQLDWLKCIGADVGAGSLTGALPAVNRSRCAVSMQLRKPTPGSVLPTMPARSWRQRPAFWRAQTYRSDPFS